MRTLLTAAILFGCLVGPARSDDNIYGPGGVNLGPSGSPAELLDEIEQQRRQRALKKKLESQRELEAIRDYKSGLTLRQQRNGHYFVDGMINSVPLVFTVDTGASYVTLPKGVASKAGIPCDGVAWMETANGRVKACTGMISRLKIGSYTLSNVLCLIAPVLNQPLLGNNVLKDFKMIQQNGQMRLIKSY